MIAGNASSAKNLFGRMDQKQKADYVLLRILNCRSRKTLSGNVLFAEKIFWRVKLDIIVKAGLGTKR